ncbi:MAG: hypothetical protein FWC62_05725 [Firmicutes bacterium]|nr:hypothetical protein [Bacillota bacterium]
MNYKKANQISNITTVAAILLALLLLLFTVPTGLFIVAISIVVVLMVCSFVVKYKFYRCPHCHAMLASSRLQGPVCKQCGEKLDS